VFCVQIATAQQNKADLELKNKKTDLWIY